jgi:hypothetical protein
MGEHKQKVNWKVAADLEVVGPQVKISSLPEGYWVQVRRYSVTGSGEIAAAEARSMATVKADALREVAGAFETQDKDTPQADDEAAGGLTPDQRRELAIRVMESASGDMVGEVGKKRAMLRYGVHLHNFDGDPAAPTDEWVEAVMEREHVANEILALIKEKNCPLARKTSGNSETSQTGNTTEQSSTPAADSSPTGATL